MNRKIKTIVASFLIVGSMITGCNSSLPGTSNKDHSRFAQNEIVGQDYEGALGLTVRTGMDFGLGGCTVAATNKRFIIYVPNKPEKGCLTVIKGAKKGTSDQIVDPTDINASWIDLKDKTKAHVYGEDQSSNIQLIVDGAVSSFNSANKIVRGDYQLYLDEANGQIDFIQKPDVLPYEGVKYINLYPAINNAPNGVTVAVGEVENREGSLTTVTQIKYVMPKAAGERVDMEVVTGICDEEINKKWRNKIYITPEKPPADIDKLLKKEFEESGVPEKDIPVFSKLVKDAISKIEAERAKPDAKTTFGVVSESKASPTKPGQQSAFVDKFPFVIGGRG